jgi:hypothetical protein
VSLLTKENALREAKVNISQELEHQAVNALRSQEELKANLALLRQCWQNEISWRAQQLEEASAASINGAAEIVDISAQIQAHCIQNEDLLSTDPSKSLPEWDRIVSLSLMTLNRMGSRADTGDGDGDEMSKSMQRLCQLSASIATAATDDATDDNSVKSERENISDLWQLFKKEVAQQTAVAKNSDIGDDMEGDVDEEIKRLVFYGGQIRVFFHANEFKGKVFFQPTTNSITYRELVSTGAMSALAPAIFKIRICRTRNFLTFYHCLAGVSTRNGKILLTPATVLKS